MPKARDIIQTALTVHLNKLAAGETLDNDTANLCLGGLNDVVDEFNGGKSLLFREILTTSAPITGASAQLGVAWPTLAPGDEILGATVQYSAGLDVPLDALTVGEYANIAIKSVAAIPRVYAYDGDATVYLYPAAAGQTVTLRTRQVVQEFADLDTEYTMPKGYRSALAALLAERMANSLVGGIKADVARAAKAARLRLQAQSANPAIIDGGQALGNILAGW